MEIDGETQATPQKVHTTRITIFSGNSTKNNSCNVIDNIDSPNKRSGKCTGIKKGLHPRSPRANNSNSCTSSTTSFHILPNTNANTPPAKRFHRVRNPFEAALAERLHLPLIASPSLFQRPTTPQFSSTQFEWTIDEVSSLKPANVEPHETQFHTSPDPDYEAKAQSAISSFFKEQQVVPSPVDCPLRNHRIILSELDGNTPITKPGRRIRECSTQTELTLPPILPKALEEALRPYFQPHLSIMEKGQNNLFDDSSNVTYESNNEMKDISLRRKLFDMHNIIVLDENRTPVGSMGMGTSAKSTNSSPLSAVSVQNGAIIGKLSDSMDRSSFGSLSPISASDGRLLSLHSPFGKYGGFDGSGDSTSNSARKSKSKLHQFLHEHKEFGEISPILPQERKSKLRCKPLEMFISKEQYRCTTIETSEATFNELLGAEADCKQQLFSPERSSSPLHSLERQQLTSAASVDNSINVKVSRLVVNSANCAMNSESKIISRAINDTLERSTHNISDDILDATYDDDGMLASQHSMQSFNCSSSNSDTPRCKRRSASRKNLSHSFSASWLDADDDDDIDNDEQNLGQEASFKINMPQITALIERETKEGQPQQTVTKHTNIGAKDEQQEHGLTLCRVDSGFNDEMITSSSSSTKSLTVIHPQSKQTKEEQQSMQHCGNEAIANTLLFGEHFSALSSPKRQYHQQQQDVDMVSCSTPSKGAAGILGNGISSSAF